MGLKIPPVPDDFGIGDDCLACHPAGQTPNYVFITFVDITPCPGEPNIPNGYTFICKQSPIAPCEYQGDLMFQGNLWRAYYDSDVPWGDERRAEISVGIQPPAKAAAFFGRELGCASAFLHNFQVCPGSYGTGGRAYVNVFSNWIILSLLNQYHFYPIPGILYEYADCGMDHQWYRICHKRDHTNIMILLDVEDIVLD